MRKEARRCSDCGCCVHSVQRHYSRCHRQMYERGSQALREKGYKDRIEEAEADVVRRRQEYQDYLADRLTLVVNGKTLQVDDRHLGYGAVVALADTGRTGLHTVVYRYPDGSGGSLLPIQDLYVVDGTVVDAVVTDNA